MLLVCRSIICSRTPNYSLYRMRLASAEIRTGENRWKPPADVPTAFEEQVQRLGLNEQTCATSEKLKRWCERNKDPCYIPESLLKLWGIQVDPNVSDRGSTR